MISTSKSFLFVHVPKTGGNSIQVILKAYADDELVCRAPHHDGVERFEIHNEKYKIQKHAPLNTYKARLEPNFYNSLFKFSTIRNPWDMMISAYFSPHHGKREWDREVFLDLLNRSHTLRDYVRSDSLLVKAMKKIGVQLRPGDLNAEMDFLLKFESLEKDFKTLCGKIDIPYTHLPNRNASSRSHYSKYYDTDLKETVRKKFIDEIQYGNYVFESK
jgi:hypothetical protein